MLTKAERNTRMMVNTPTRVLFVLDRTIFLESVCRGVGKSWEGRGRHKAEFSQYPSDSPGSHWPHPVLDAALLTFLSSSRVAQP